MKRLITTIMLASLITSIVSMSSPLSKTAFANSDYNNAALISDGLFTAYGSMSISDIQTFLNSHNSGLKNFSDTEDCGPSNGSHYSYYTQFYSCGQSASAAKIIYDAAHAYQISPKVILATLQKEQSLITTSNPISSQYNYAMGYGCPDSGSCGYAGFFNQVDNGTWQLKTDIELSSGNNYWGYTPSSYPCNGSTRYFSTALKAGNNVTFYDDNGTAYTNFVIANRSTAALYCYTPHAYNNPNGINGHPRAGSTGQYYSGSYNFVVAYQQWFGPTTSEADTYVLSFVRLNYHWESNGNVENLGYPSIGSYGYATRTNYSSYPSLADYSGVIPLYKPNGDLSFIRLNHKNNSGHLDNVEIVSYSASSGYKTISENMLVSYPAVADYTAVFPLYKPNGDLSFIRLNYPGNAQIVSYTANSGFRNISENMTTAYPSTTPDRAVVPLYKPNGDLSFIRLNHSSGNVEVVSYGPGGGFKQLGEYTISSYPATTPDGAVVPLYKPNGDLSFIRLNHSGGVEVVSYGNASGFKQLGEYVITGYPSISPDGAVRPLYTR